MPNQVIAAVILLGVQFSIAVVGEAFQMNWDHLQQAQVIVAIYTAVSALWVYGLYRRQNWLRWITVAYTVYQVVMLPLTLPSIHDVAQLTVYWVAVVLGVTAVVLLCLPKARQWYNRSAVP
jgi:hypothetical protein